MASFRAWPTEGRALGVGGSRLSTRAIWLLGDGSPADVRLRGFGVEAGRLRHRSNLPLSAERDQHVRELSESPEHQRVRQLCHKRLTLEVTGRFQRHR